MNWDKEFDATLKGLKPDYMVLIEASSKTPSADDLASITACIVGADMAFSLNKSDPADISQKVAGFFTFCSGELRMPKKAVPKTLADKLDKLAKDWVAQTI